jgi:hypothetical protein
MAPEQWLGEDIDCRADIYAFGRAFSTRYQRSTLSSETWYEYQMHHLNVIPSRSRHIQDSERSS